MKLNFHLPNFGTAGLQECLLGENFNQWSTMYNTAWNVFSIFMGECVFDANRITSKAFKLLIALCMFYFFIICAAYSGILKGFLTLPQLSKPIETPQDVCLFTNYITVLFFFKTHAGYKTSR